MRTSQDHRLLGRLALTMGTLLVLVPAAPAATAVSRPGTVVSVANSVGLEATPSQQRHPYVFSGEAGSANAAEQRMTRLGFVGCGAGGSTNAVEHCAFPSRP